jgi:hypothetical protein
VSGDDDRPKRSWREIDQMRDGTRPRDQGKARGRYAEAREKRASEQYVKQLDRLFTDTQGGAEGEALAAAVRAAHGTPELVASCREFRDALGMPHDPALLSLFLDCDDREFVIAALEELLQLARAGSLEASSGLRSQIRLHAQSFENAVAEPAEDLLELI